MFAAGVVDEVRAIGSISATPGQVIGLREIRDLLAGKITQPECIRLIQARTRQYAKRQVTWFARDTDFARLNLTGIDHGDALRRFQSI